MILGLMAYCKSKSTISFPETWRSRGRFCYVEHL